jgi:cell wall-associated NlpC family hydrolase
MPLPTTTSAHTHRSRRRSRGRSGAALTVGLGLAAALAAPLSGALPHANAAPPAVETATATKPAPVRAADLRAARSERTMRVAAHYKGVPYRYGGTTPRGFDCSGYTRYVLAKLNKRLPRTAQEQFEQARRVARPRVGDLLFYHSGSRQGHVYHVVIYAGHGQVWHAPNPGTPVKKGKIYATHWTAGRY